MPGIKVFSDLGLNVNNATAACFLATVSNSTAASFLSTVSNSTAASFLATVSNSTAASFLSTVSNSTAASFLATVSNSTAASFLSTVSNSTAASFLATVSNATAACFLATINNTTAACFVTQLGARTTTDSSEAVTSAVTTYANATSQNILSQSDCTFTVLNNSIAANSALVKITLSPDNTNYADDPGITPVTLTQNAMTFLVPGRFVKYARVSYAAVTASSTISLSIWFQARV